MPGGDTYRVSIIQQGSGGINAANVVHFQQLGDDIADHRPETDLADIVDNQLLVLMIALMSDEWNIRMLHIQRTSPTPHAGFDYGVTNNAGSVSGPAYPPDHGICVSWYTSQLNRAGRGRNRFAGVPITYAHGGGLTTTAYNLWLVATAAWLPNLDGPNGYQFKFVVAPFEGAGHGVTVQRVHPRLTTLRSRTEGNGW